MTKKVEEKLFAAQQTPYRVSSAALSISVFASLKQQFREYVCRALKPGNVNGETPSLFSHDRERPGRGKKSGV